MTEYKCPDCGESLLQNLEEVLTVTVLRTSRIIGIEYESEDGEVLFDYDAMPNEDDVDCDTPVIYQCGFCGYEINKQTVVEVLKHGC
jgi:DNA-directed RNA polymerase subunit RPC12/RpoP